MQVAGNFHFAPGRSFQAGGVHVHDLIPFGTEEFDISHTIHQAQLWGGLPLVGENPLNGRHCAGKLMLTTGKGRRGAYQYFLKVFASSSIEILQIQSWGAASSSDLYVICVFS